MDVQKQAENGSQVGQAQQKEPQTKVALYLELAARLRCTAISLPSWRVFLRARMLRDAATFTALAKEEVSNGR